ncbi:glucose-1-phosphate cytidylyltransferase [Chloroflexota bacterium]
MKTVLLAGGFGTRLQEETARKPKPMVEIGGYPILWHIMNSYAAWGHKEFLVALGYKSEVIKEYFLNYYYKSRNLTISLADGTIDAAEAENTRDWTLHLVDTGLNTQTGGRIKRLSSWIDNETFMMTYGDGVSNVAIDKLLQFHKTHGRLATMTVVRPRARFGDVRIDGAGVVNQFKEKPDSEVGWINGGFFVLEPAVLDYISDDATYFEREPLEQMVANEQLMAFQHTGFWQCMDTVRDLTYLENLWQSGEAQWKIW